MTSKILYTPQVVGIFEVPENAIAVLAEPDVSRVRDLLDIARSALSDKIHQDSSPWPGPHAEAACSRYRSIRQNLTVESNDARQRGRQGIWWNLADLLADEAITYAVEVAGTKATLEDVLRAMDLRAIEERSLRNGRASAYLAALPGYRPEELLDSPAKFAGGSSVAMEQHFIRKQLASAVVIIAANSAAEANVETLADRYGSEDTAYRPRRA